MKGRTVRHICISHKKYRLKWKCARQQHNTFKVFPLFPQEPDMKAALPVYKNKSENVYDQKGKLDSVFIRPCHISNMRIFKIAQSWVFFPFFFLESWIEGGVIREDSLSNGQHPLTLQNNPFSKSHFNESLCIMYTTICVKALLWSTK